MSEIWLQPKQAEIYDLIASSRAPWIGVWGGRGCAKSFALQAIMLRRRLERPGTLGCIVMRNYDQVFRYHIEPMLRQWPQLLKGYRKGDKSLMVQQRGQAQSQIDFSYGEALPDIERRFRSGNYDDIFVDQAEQFMESELREMKKACRSSNGSKMLLSLNMGGAGIQWLRKVFYTREVGERESPDDYTGVHVFPWDNVYWSLDALREDGHTVEDYYSWTDEQRMIYCATRSTFGRTLNSEDDALRNRDWLGSWESLEGAYYGRVFDREAILLDRSQVAQLVQYWDARWLSQDWGKQHYNVTYWHAATQVSPERAKRILGWDVERPFKAVVTYRELVVNELSSADVAQAIVEATPEAERKQIKSFFLSPDAFGERDSENTTADNLGAGLRRAGLPEPEAADTERAGGWMLLYDLMQSTKRHAATAGDCWLIGAECPHLLESIPLLMRDPKDLDVVLKTDKGQAKLEQDCSEAARYGLKSFLSPRRVAPLEVRAAEVYNRQEDPHDRAMAMRAFYAKQARPGRANWRQSATL